MWQSIGQAIASETGQSFSIKDKKPISGGDINLAFKVYDEEHSYFIKLNDKSRLSHFEAEAYSLGQLKAMQTFITPQCIALGTTLDKSYIVLSHIDFCNDNAALWYQLGQQLAQMHKNSSHGQFGWQYDNYLGNTRQPNDWQSNWRSFFAEQRIGWQLQLLSERSVYMGDIEHIIDMCHNGLAHHQVKPSLVHGDLWQGNIGFCAQGPVIFDPACYYGDREVDIAMSELFGQFPGEFYRGYQELYPLSEGYERRKNIYNFYHILNHANLFGGIYIDQAKALLGRLFALAIH
ncbi:fructosamine kinase family protein [Thalassomonas haliotis]|uniref:Fructosamine kinase family protein n=1 Tax=Thalassomonas haliotis TaxID=485448 RepID=A0ABY7V7F0_9GAMM|nr:fructosamine kinase family protein [Thalassomonas haliotis]WDE09603.1 fructosamine kinase family protein [Thalassomonas haliotis]